ncbi:MAG: cytochrome c oxidase subunit II [Fimbriimonadales bacterium]|jgi:cytochrome c oxidase subunit 2|nr:cytochrome c oxidase subunit II [Armatimonadota bacterium]MCX7686415.1 cytochrome c oxidase subunit II [Fimbriimonadales bacterium]CUU03837.1 cytochrome c oxidase subunit 2 [Armatimonadetes bacterium GBS]CUU33843.1 cytochrome c oxidase subunit 2 [Armatimonadetes bacterium GXS]CUU35367.1 cytochrome c oxidase subunit 2 [Armatimonadetes bacterium DC]GBC91480.1 Cytochrome c oxidase subunit 2 [bacterium HR14]
MDRFEKNAIVLALALLFFFFGLVVYAAKALQIEVPTCLTGVNPFQEGRVIVLDEGAKRYQVNLLARMWNFEPYEIRLPAGAKVDLYLTSRDVVHGLRINYTNVNLMAIPGTVSYARVRFDKPGVYSIVCHEYCGINHHLMAGKIIVE